MLRGVSSHFILLIEQ